MADKPLHQVSPRVRHKRRKAREEILATAQRVLHEHGTAALTLATVAGELGMTKQALYHYFPSKDALARSLVAGLLEDEIAVLIAAIEQDAGRAGTLSTLIRSFYSHYIDRLDAFRIVYCYSQLTPGQSIGMDADTIRDEINPRTRQLFDVLEQRLTGAGSSREQRRQARRMAFSAWTAALGLITMLSMAAASKDPLIHADADLLDCLADTFERAAGALR